LRLVIVTPAAAGSRHGNRNTALRWARHLRALGHRVAVEVEWDGAAHDAMIALHARRSHASAAAWKRRHPSRPLALVLTGTDLYRDIRSDASARESLALADRLVVLQAAGLAELAPSNRAKAEVIYQSVRPTRRHAPPRGHFLVTVIGHLREEKDPLLTAHALRHLDASRKVRLVQLGKAMDDRLARKAQALMRADPRYRWLGEVDHARAMRWLGRSHAMVISSRMEGGANVVSEAIAIGVPVLASRIPGNIGLLGARYPGYFPVEDDHALARLMARAIDKPDFLALLADRVRAQRPLVDPLRERASLARLAARLSAA
jgi:putative glycosyltransferase (TIGR04348 family)